MRFRFTPEQAALQQENRAYFTELMARREGAKYFAGMPVDKPVILGISFADDPEKRIWTRAQNLRPGFQHDVHAFLANQAAER